MLSVGPKQNERSANSYFNTIFLQQAIFGVSSALVTWFGEMLLIMVYPSAQLKAIVTPLAAVVLCCQTQDFLRRYFFSITRPVISFVTDAIRYLGQLVALLMLFTVTKDAANTRAVLWVLAGAAALASLTTTRRLPSWTWPGTAVFSISWRSRRSSRCSRSTPCWSPTEAVQALSQDDYQKFGVTIKNSMAPDDGSDGILRPP